MPDANRDVIHFTRYFNMGAPGSAAQILLLFILGVVTGVLSDLFIHPMPVLTSILIGASSGVILVSVPAMLTVMLIKTMERRLQLKHALFAVLAVSSFYGLLIVTNSVVFSFLHSYVLAYVLLILFNAGIYGYWFVINRVVMNQRKSRIFTAAIQPVLNTSFYLPMSRYVLSLNVPFSTVLIKLWAGMLVFMAIGYLILYIIDRPAKKALKISGIAIITAMINQWLYDVIKEADILSTTSTKRDVAVDILALKGKSGYKAIFVKPDIHYGPFSDVGGSIAPEYIGKQITNKYNAAPFIMHGAVNLEDNPISTAQIRDMSGRIIDQIRGFSSRAFRPASGHVSLGYEKPCKAICINIGDVCILTLTKAPEITEDIRRDIGIHLTSLASRSFKNVMLIDAHNSRFEYASRAELRGVHKASRYVSRYEKAISEAVYKCTRKKSSQLRFGSASQILRHNLNNNDIGKGFASIGIFGFGKRKFCMVSIDANNMLPGFREYFIKHIREKFGMEAELYTTDTHSVNTIAFPASNVLGRYTKPKELLPIMDVLVTKALNEMERVRYAYSQITIKNFKVWGEGSEEVLMKVSRDVIRIGKRRVPFIIAAGFIIAAWVIYLA